MIEHKLGLHRSCKILNIAWRAKGPGCFLEYQTNEGVRIISVRTNKLAPRCKFDLHADVPLMNAHKGGKPKSGHRLTLEPFWIFHTRPWPCVDCSHANATQQRWGNGILTQEWTLYVCTRLCINASRNFLYWAKTEALTDALMFRRMPTDWKLSQYPSQLLDAFFFLACKTANSDGIFSTSVLNNSLAIKFRSLRYCILLFITPVYVLCKGF